MSVKFSRRYAWYIVGLLTAINFFNYVDRMVIVTMKDDLRRVFGFSDDQLGAFWFAFFLVHAVATLPLGWASDHFDRRKIIAFGVIAWSLATLGSAYAWGFLSMLLLRGAIGIGEAAYGPPANALLCEVFPEKKATIVAIFNGGMFLGVVAGMAAGIAIGFPTAFEAVAIPGIVLGLLVLVMRVPPERTVQTKRPQFSTVLRDGLRTLRIPTLRWMLPAGVFVSFAAGGYAFWIPDFTVQYKHLTLDDAVRIYSGITATAGVLGVVIAGVIADRLLNWRAYGRTLTMAVGFLASVPFAIAVVFFVAPWPFFTCGWFLFFFMTWYNGPMAAVIDDVVDDADAGTAQATFVFFLHVLGSGPGGYVMGVISRHYTLQYAFLLPAGALFLAGICSLMAARHIGRDMAARAARAAATGSEKLALAS